MLITLLLAVEEAAKQTAPEPPWWYNFIFLGPIILLGYLLLFAPMRKQEKQRQARVAALKKNDKIINSGGIIGVVESIKEKENEVVLRGGLRVTKSSIVQIVTEDTTKEQKEGGA